ncbi:DUF2283 domain-containing protein [Actinocrinis puniceicyclus]|uniref:DUF2283 domain-containing protein n=1 Tax=Actinocrinis puniceicyclus TaxID=977794 RepID=A0A8J7WM58_9ACTN|nr:DUF2283 domain-containing protein [Actinocrinis puniceicyclus]MBS2964906.1 DUF2283 domain-containing protein [Actinocrinis puniceicyclus]
MTEPTITIEIDPTADAAYILLMQNDVARTVEFSPELAVDLDELDVVVGIELLTLAVSVTHDDINRLISRFHVQSGLQDAVHVALDAITNLLANAPGIRTATAAGRTPYGTLRPTPRAVLEECP